MKKTFFALTLSALMLVALPFTGFAHGHGGSSKTTSKTYSLCTVEHCNTIGNHMHNGITYTGHSVDDGHYYHRGNHNSGGHH